MSTDMVTGITEGPKEKWSKYMNKGYTGLVNLGNTCFINACLQVLNHTYELNEIIVDKNTSVTSNSPDALIFREWANLQTLMWSNNGIVYPNKFVHHVQVVAQEKHRELFTGWAQNDMPEFLLFMIDCFHNSMARQTSMKIFGNKKSKVDRVAFHCYQMLQAVYEKEYSEVMDLFYAIYVSELSSLDGKQIHNLKPELFFMLDLPIPTEDPTHTVNLYDCFNLFTKAETLEGENSWKNDKTGQYEAVKKRITFFTLPKILVITLKRFSTEGHKLNTQVEFPTDGLDLSEYVSGYIPQKYKYDLYGVCNHQGGLLGGHYNSFVRNAKNEWILYNDANYQILSDTTSIISPMAYCLFYRIRS